MTSLHTQFPRLHDEPAFGTGWPAHPTHGMARLSLFINGTAYHVRPLSTDALIAIKAFRLRKFDGTEYDIASNAAPGQMAPGSNFQEPASTYQPGTMNQGMNNMINGVGRMSSPNRRSVHQRPRQFRRRGAEAESVTSHETGWAFTN